MAAKLINSEKHLNSVNRKDFYAKESNEMEKSRKWAIKKLRELKNTVQ